MERAKVPCGVAAVFAIVVEYGHVESAASSSGWKRWWWTLVHRHGLRSRCDNVAKERRVVVVNERVRRREITVEADPCALQVPPEDAAAPSQNGIITQ